MADEVKIDEEGLRRSARSQIIVDTIERSLEKMIFVESNLGKDMEPQDLFQVKREACLLYTSPSPRDQRGSRMPSSA